MRLAIESLFLLFPGLLILGRSGLHRILARVTQVKAELEDATRDLKSRLAAELDDTSDVRDAFWSNELLRTYRSSPTSASALLIDNRVTKRTS
jgi:hypothetical protein